MYITFKKFCFFCIAICLASINALHGQNIIGHPYLQDLSQDKVTIMWETDIDVTAFVQWGISPFQLINITSSSSVTGSGSSKIHSAELSPLLAGTKYYYKVSVTGGADSKLLTLKTLMTSDQEQNTQFIAISDMQRDGSKPDKFEEIIDEGIIPIIFSEVGDSLYDLEAILIPGDLVVTGGNYSQWQNHFFSKIDSLAVHVPIYPVPGNHEYQGGGNIANFKKYFSLPQNGVIPEECWYKDISNVRIIGLNSNSNSTNQNLQLDWLGEVLDSTCNNEYIDFVFAELHHPFKSELWTPGENGFTGKVIDSLETFTESCTKASIHFFGHTHGYSRGQSRDHKHLWMNVATAGGAIDNWGEFPNADYEEFVKSQDEYGFVLIDVEAGDDPLFTIKRYSRGDQDQILDNVLRDQLTILNNDIAPTTPLNLFPDGDTISSHCITLKASSFYGIDDIHQGSHWQIATSDTFLSSVFQEDWAQNENFYNEINTQADDDLTDEMFPVLTSNDTLYWRVRYRNQNLEWSKWSLPTTFFLAGGVDTLSGNLVLNEGAENGIQNWSGDIEALNQGECGSVPPFSGNFNFGVGGICQNESSVGTAYQGISLTSFENQILNDKVSLGFGAYIRNFSGSDIPEMYIELYENDNLVETSPIISNTTSTWTIVTESISIPEEVDSCVVVLKGTRTAGTDNDCYFDFIQVYLIDKDDCSDCYGASNQDNDQDGFCSDIDCDDMNGDIHPGAIELCNGLDDNCDGKADFGATVSWTGLAGTNLWSDALNWDQELVPLPCQHVVIDNTSSVLVDDGNFECFSLEVANTNDLTIGSGAVLIINSQSLNNVASAKIQGSMIINGRCDLKNSQGLGFEVFGTLINNNKLNLIFVNLQTIYLHAGSRFDSLGKTVLK